MSRDPPAGRPRRDPPSGAGRVPPWFAAVLALAVVAVGLGAAFAPAAAQTEGMSTDRTLSPTAVAPGGAVEVTVTLTFDEPTSGTLAERLDPDLGDVTVTDTEGIAAVNELEDGFNATFADRERVSVTYELAVDESATANDSVTLGGFLDDGGRHDLPETVVDVTDEPIVAIDTVAAPGETTHVDAIELSATVTNVGESAGTHAFEVRLGGTVLATAEGVDLAPGEQRTVTFDPFTVDEPGTYDLTVMAPDDRATHRLEVRAATGAVAFEDQLVGERPAGVPAVFGTDIAAAAGRSLVLTYDDRLGNPVVAGIREVPEDWNGQTATVPVEDGGELPGEFSLHVVANADGATVGDHLPGGATVLASDTAVVFDGQVRFSDQAYPNLAETVVVDETELYDADSRGGTPYIVAVHEVVGTSLGDVLGRSSTIWGRETGVEVDLDPPIEDETSRSLAAVLHRNDQGSLGPPIRTATPSGPEPVAAVATVSITDSPRYLVDRVDTNAPVEAGETFVAEVTIRNDGEAADTQSVWLSVGEHVDLPEVEVQPGGRTTVTLEWAPSADDVGEHVVRVETADDAMAVPITVEAASGSPTPTATPDPIPGFGVALALLAAALVVAAALRRRAG